MNRCSLLPKENPCCSFSWASSFPSALVLLFSSAVGVRSQNSRVEVAAGRLGFVLGLERARFLQTKRPPKKNTNLLDPSTIPDPRAHLQTTPRLRELPGSAETQSSRSLPLLEGAAKERSHRGSVIFRRFFFAIRGFFSSSAFKMMSS